jgi:hypothetical protein
MIQLRTRDNAASIKALFDRGFELAQQYPHDSVLTYVAKKIRNAEIRASNWEVCEPLLLRACFGEPTVLPTLLSIYEEHEEADDDRLRLMIERLCAYHAPLHQSYEVAWSLWLAKKRGLALAKKTAKLVAQIDDDIVALIALDLRANDLLPLNDVSLWQQHLTGVDLYSEHWLLAYEALEQGWLSHGRNGDYIAADDFFSILRNHAVHFYDTGMAGDEGYSEYTDEDFDETEDSAVGSEDSTVESDDIEIDV